MYDLKIMVKVDYNNMAPRTPQELSVRVERFFIKDGFLTLIYPDKRREYLNSNAVFSIVSYKVDEEEDIEEEKRE